MKDCIFCQIISGNLPPVYIIHEDEKHLAILDLFPQSEGQTLCIPKKHIKKVWDQSEEELSEFFIFSQKIANHYRKTTGSHNFTFILEELVPHAHIKIYPNVVENGFSKKINEFIHENDMGKLSDEKANKLLKRYKL